jgi:hypothetical protein
LLSTCTWRLDQVDDYRAYRQAGFSEFGGGLHRPQSGANAGQQLFKPKGLGHVVIGTGFEALDLGVEVAARRQQNNRFSKALAPQRSSTVMPS